MGRAQPAFAPVRDGWEKFRKTDIEYRVYFIFINPQSIDLEASYIFIIFVYVYIYNNKIKLYNPNNYAMILHYYKENYIHSIRSYMKPSVTMIPHLQSLRYVGVEVKSITIYPLVYQNLFFLEKWSNSTMWASLIFKGNS